MTVTETVKREQEKHSVECKPRCASIRPTKLSILPGSSLCSNHFPSLVSPVRFGFPANVSVHAGSTNPCRFLLRAANKGDGLLALL